MALRDFFSRRAKRAARAGAADVYQYDDLPQVFRVQVVHIWKRALGYLMIDGPRNVGPPLSVWEEVEGEVAESHGLLGLNSDIAEPFGRVANYFLQLKETPKALDVIEAVFSSIDRHVRPDFRYTSAFVQQHPDDAIADLNSRFREHGVGYQYAGGQIVRVDSQFLHAETVKPTLGLLAEPGFTGPQDEFLRSHKHYREGKHKEAINDALKAFESTLKVICAQRGWPFDKNKDTAKTLLEIVFQRQLVPSYLQNAFGGVRAVLEGAVPTVRNRASGHGQGENPISVPDYLAAYVLHMTASNIVFLVAAHNAKP